MVGWQLVPVGDGVLSPGIAPGEAYTCWHSSAHSGHAAVARDASLAIELYCLSYVSTQSEPFGGEALRALLKAARSNNQRFGITGLLLHRRDSFFQILEGDRDIVRWLFDRIMNDPRHERVEVVVEGPIEQREFSDWQMAFVDLEGQDAAALPGYSEILSDTPSARSFLRGLSRSKKLALLFSVMD